MFTVNFIQTNKDGESIRSFGNTYETLAEARSRYFLELAQVTINPNLQKVAAEIEDDNMAKLAFDTAQIEPEPEPEP